MERIISQNLKHAVEMFYQSDEFSRMCPGKKGNVFMKIDRVK